MGVPPMMNQLAMPVKADPIVGLVGGRNQAKVWYHRRALLYSATQAQLFTWGQQPRQTAPHRAAWCSSTMRQSTCYTRSSKSWARRIGARPGRAPGVEDRLGGSPAGRRRSAGHLCLCPCPQYGHREHAREGAGRLSARPRCRGLCAPLVQARHAGEQPRHQRAPLTVWPPRRPVRGRAESAERSGG